MVEWHFLCSCCTGISDPLDAVVAQDAFCLCAILHRASSWNLSRQVEHAGLIWASWFTVSRGMQRKKHGDEENVENNAHPVFHVFLAPVFLRCIPQPRLSMLLHCQLYHLCKNWLCKQILQSEFVACSAHYSKLYCPDRIDLITSLYLSDKFFFVPYLVYSDSLAGHVR